MRLSAKKRRYIEKHAGKRSPDEIAKKLDLPVDVVRKVTGSLARRAGPAVSGSPDKVARPGLASDAPAESQRIVIASTVSSISAERGMFE